MDVFSEIEIEALVEDALSLEQEAEAVIGEDMSELQAELAVIGTALNPTLNFDPYMGEWLGDGSGADLDIGSDAANWLSELMGADLAPEVTDTDAPDDLSDPDLQEKSKVLFTEDIDEVVSTGTRNTSWDYSDILEILAIATSLGDGILAGDEDGPDIPDRWKVKPPKTPTDGVKVDRDGLTIPDNKDTKEQEEMETLLGDIWTMLMRAESGDLTEEWGAEYNENTGRYHVFPLPPLVG